MDHRVVMAEGEVVDHPGPQVVGEGAGGRRVERQHLGQRVGGQDQLPDAGQVARALSRNASRMPSTSTVIGSVPGGDGSPTAGDRLAAAHLQPQVLVALHDVKAAPSVWAIIVGRSDGPRARAHLVPARATPPHTAKPSAMAVPVIHRSLTSPPVHDHLGWISRCSTRRADSACWPPQRLLQPPAVERAHAAGSAAAARSCPRSDDARRRRATKSALSVQHRPGQPLDPLGRGRDRVGLQQHERARAQPLGDREGRAQRRPRARARRGTAPPRARRPAPRARPRSPAAPAAAARSRVASDEPASADDQRGLQRRGSGGPARRRPPRARASSVSALL